MSLEFKELRKQWRMAKKEQEEMSRDRARLAQMEREQEDQRRAEAYGMSMPMSSVVSQQLPSGLPMAAHGMRSELVNVGIPIDSGMGANLNPHLQPSMGVSVGGLSGSMAGPILSPGSLAVTFSPSAMPGHGYPTPAQFAHSRTAGSYEFPLQHGQPQPLHPHAQAQGQVDAARHHHRASFDAEAHGQRYEYDQRRASLDHGQMHRGSYDKAAFDQGHRVGGAATAYVDMQQQQQMNFIYRRRGSQPYPSPHSITHSPHALTHAQGAATATTTTSPRSVYSAHSAGGLVYPDEEYAESYDYRERQPQAQQQQSPVEERYATEGEYYIDRSQQQQQRSSWEQLPPLAQPHPHTLAHGHLVGPGLVPVEETATPSTDGAGEGEGGGGEPGEPLLTSQGHVSLGSNRLPANSTLLTPLPNFRGYAQHEEQWQREEEEELQRGDERRRSGGGAV